MQFYPIPHASAVWTPPGFRGKVLVLLLKSAGYTPLRVAVEARRQSHLAEQHMGILLILEGAIVEASHETIIHAMAPVSRVLIHTRSPTDSCALDRIFKEPDVRSAVTAWLKKFPRSVWPSGKLKDNMFHPTLRAAQQVAPTTEGCLEILDTPDGKTPILRLYGDYTDGSKGVFEAAQIEYFCNMAYVKLNNAYSGLIVDVRSFNYRWGDDLSFLPSIPSSVNWTVAVLASKQQREPLKDVVEESELFFDLDEAARSIAASASRRLK